MWWVGLALAMPLQKAVERWADDGVGDRRAVIVEHLGETWVDLDADRRQTPASVVKWITTAAVLHHLGPEHQLRTSLVTTGPVVDGVLQGDLVIEAGGDPSLGESDPLSVMRDWALAVRAAGIMQVTGRVRVERGAWADPPLGAGWMWDDQPYPFSAPFGPLVLDLNRATPACEAVGEVMAAPEDCVVSQLVAQLAAEGVLVAGHETESVLRTALHERISPPLAVLTRTMLERSDNLYAEVLARALADDGRFATAWPRIEEVLLLAGVEPGAVVLSDGSGLSRYNLLTARSLSTITGWMRTQPWGAEALESLPVAGRSGTLQGRGVGTVVEGRVRGKTGSMRGVRNLVGVVDEDVVFVVMSSGFVDNQASARAREDTLMQLLVLGADGRVRRRDLRQLMAARQGR